MSNTKILVHRSMALGDVILTTPIIRELYKKHNGECEITVSTLYSDVFVNNPYISRVIQPNQVNPTEYDFAYNLDLVYERAPHLHVVDAYKNYVFGDDFVLPDYSYDLISTAEDEKYVKKFIADHMQDKDFIVVHIRKDGWPSRQLSMDNWGYLLEQVLDNHNVNIVQIGGHNEGSFSGDDKLINGLGKFSVVQLKELISRAKVFVGLDSAPCHIAGCTTTPNITFFTSVKAEYRQPNAHMETFEPLATPLDCYGCHGDNPAPATEFTCRRGDVACAESFDLDAVYQKIAKHL